MTQDYDDHVLHTQERRSDDIDELWTDQSRSLVIVQVTYSREYVQ